MKKRNKIKFEAIFLPDDKGKEHFSKKGFSSEDSAWNYVAKHICKGCKRDFSNNPLKSFCAAEWMVKSYEEKSEKDFITASEVADNLKVNIMTIYRYIKAGKLKAYKIGKEFRIDKAEFNNFLDKVKTK